MMGFVWFGLGVLVGHYVVPDVKSFFRRLSGGED